MCPETLQTVNRSVALVRFGMSQIEAKHGFEAFSSVSRARRFGGVCPGFGEIRFFRRETRILGLYRGNRPKEC